MLHLMRITCAHLWQRQLMHNVKTFWSGGLSVHPCFGVDLQKTDYPPCKCSVLVHGKVSRVRGPDVRSRERALCVREWWRRPSVGHIGQDGHLEQGVQNTGRSLVAATW